MVRDTTFWRLAYHLCGVTLLGETPEASLGTLPYPVRTAVLKTVRDIDDTAIFLHLEQKTLLHQPGQYEWVEAWHPQAGSVPSEPIRALLNTFPKQYQAYQRLALWLFRQATQKGDETLHVADVMPRLPLLTIALLDTLALLERVAALYGHAVTWPHVTVHLVGNVPAHHDRLLQHYRGSARGEQDSRVDAHTTPLLVQQAETLPQIELAYCSKAAAFSPHTPSNAKSIEELRQLAKTLESELGNELPLGAMPASFEKTTINYFARRYFPYAEMHEEQRQLLERALRQDSGMGILPTSFGKSAIFQLFALLVPRAALVISPLRALMRDQLHALRRRGWMGAEMISSNDTAEVKDAKLQAFAEHKYRLLYISPERLQIKSFRDELKATIENTPVGALVVDEAHCVSEWGHDFRPAYLQIGPVREALEEASGRTVPIIALTATASRRVREDIIGMLNLPEGSVVQLSSSDRPNLSLSVHPVETRQGDSKAAMLKQLLKEDIPRALKRPFNELIAPDAKGTYPHAGVVFGIYANAHGRATFDEGVHKIADVIRRNIVGDENLVQVHASTAPTLCPVCRSTLYTRNTESTASSNGPVPKYICTKCGHKFNDNDKKKAKGWDKETIERQDGFQEDAFPILVATKGYGMGIDKRNIRYIVHHAFSGGFEGYYQEAGRAGRDNKQSHVALV